jgi:hypothetical protein
MTQCSRRNHHVGPIDVEGLEHGLVPGTLDPSGSLTDGHLDRSVVHCLAGRSCPRLGHRGHRLHHRIAKGLEFLRHLDHHHSHGASSIERVRKPSDDTALPRAQLPDAPASAVNPGCLLRIGSTSGAPCLRTRARYHRCAELKSGRGAPSTSGSRARNQRGEAPLLEGRCAIARVGCL